LKPVCQIQGYRLPVAWPFLGAPVGAGAPALTHLQLPVSMQMAQAPQAVASGTAASSATAAAAAAHAAAAAAATPIMLAPRPPHTAVQAAAPTAATTRRRYDDHKSVPKRDPDLRVLGENARLKAEFKKQTKKIVYYVYRRARCKI